MTEINPNTDPEKEHGDSQEVTNNKVSYQYDNWATTNGSTIEVESINRSDEPLDRQRVKSVYQRYENTVPKKQKNIIASLVSSLMIISLWLVFIVPSVWLIWAFADYFLDRLDPLSEETVSNILRPESCTRNITIQTAIDELRRVATGGFNTTNFTCVSTFVSNGTQCVPECLVWFPGGQTYYNILIIIVPILSFITLIAASIGASTWLFRKSLWKFPHIISLYLIVCVIMEGKYL
ncbi:hypothetical protein LOD99_13517 [Oopsacas minuta]|uniref:Uncharacterized protein n=1 Tax=Oopsacas minuta TaxID=111878 RepID=A0AAV7KP09_9METZ|nr:hypothetical protein LOD99_13517 [Oopsacas minuta]